MFQNKELNRHRDRENFGVKFEVLFFLNLKAEFNCLLNKKLKCKVYLLNSNQRYSSISLVREKVNGQTLNNRKLTNNS